MFRKLMIVVVLASFLFVAGCRHSKVQNPIANIDSKQPDKVLFDRAMDAMKHGKYSVARTLLETCINTYPDSEYIARAKLSLGDSWYAEGGTAAMQQAEAEYKDFRTFFPNLPEAAEAQMKVANIHYRQMEKPDRDFNQAMRAEEEYKDMIKSFPDSKLVPEAKQRLREIQEILAERQYRIAHFYYLRDNMPASQARFKSLVESYPLYSNIDEALYTLGNIYQREANAVRIQKNIKDVDRERTVAELEKSAIEAYSRIITRYPAMGRTDDARKKLAELKAPIPTPTAEAIAASRAEEEGREETGRFGRVMGNFKKHPDIAKAAKSGEPNMEDEEVDSPVAFMKHIESSMKGETAAPSNNKVGVETIGSGKGAAPGPNQPIPGSGTATESNGTNATPTPPPQVNDVGQTSQAGTTDQQNVNDKQDSSSKKKGKKGLRKLIPF
ncbi:MAG TPA: outer membrane protein assembly factor BamD [Candidatus Angelobacter sp.]|jgi:outer membrane protein assembly factor BamD|nr:outer membrane protein assembly factor BamD [Candidatus Angelobacter sp.]